MGRTWATAGVVLAIMFWVLFGAWAMLSPASFYDAVATFPPYNPHFLRDAGAFMIGLGAGVAMALRVRDALVVALGATAVAGVLHVVSHVVDHGRGGSLASTVGLGVLAVVLAGAALAQHRALRGP